MQAHEGEAAAAVAVVAAAPAASAPARPSALLPTLHSPLCPCLPAHPAVCVQVPPRAPARPLTHDLGVYAQVLAAAEPQRQDGRRPAAVLKVPLPVMHQLLELCQHLQAGRQKGRRGRGWAGGGQPGAGLRGEGWAAPAWRSHASIAMRATQRPSHCASVAAWLACQTFQQPAHWNASGRPVNGSRQRLAHPAHSAAAHALPAMRAAGGGGPSPSPSPARCGCSR